MPKPKVAKVKVGGELSEILQKLSGHIEKNYEDISTLPTTYEKFMKLRSKMREFMVQAMNVFNLMKNDKYVIPLLRELINDINKLLKSTSGFETILIDHFQGKLSSERFDEYVDAYCKIINGQECSNIFLFGSNIKKGNIYNSKNFNEFLEIKNNLTTDLMLFTKVKPNKSMATIIETFELVDNIEEYIRTKDSQEVYKLVRSLFRITKDIYDLVMTPDLDIDAIHENLAKMIDKMSCRIPAAKKLNKVIHGTKELFRKNFGSYFKASKKSGNSIALMTNYLEDVIDYVKNDDEGKQKYSLSDIAALKKVLSEVVKMMATNACKMRERAKTPSDLKKVSQIEKAMDMFGAMLNNEKAFDPEEFKSTIEKFGLS